MGSLNKLAALPPNNKTILNQWNNATTGWSGYNPVTPPPGWSPPYQYPIHPNAQGIKPAQKAEGDELKAHAKEWFARKAKDISLDDVDFGVISRELASRDMLGTFETESVFNIV